MNRRQFCKSTLNLGVLSAASSLFSLPTFSWAQNNKNPQFVISILLDGGWDITLASNPWTAAVRPAEQDMFIEYRTDELIPHAGSYMGPAMKPLQPFFDRMTVVNGMFLTATDGGHDSAKIYSTTGNGQGHLGVLPVELEGNIFNSPFGSLANTSVFTGGKNKTIWDLNSLSGEIASADLLLDFDDKETEFSKARKALIFHGDKINRYNQLFKNANQNESQGHAIASAFRSGLSQSVFLRLSNDSLDTHSNHEGTHKRNLTGYIQKVADLLAILKSSPGIHHDYSENTAISLLDQTTVIVTSDFARTPALNGSQGKDHNPQTNSTVIFSPKMKPIIAGASTLVTRSQSDFGTAYLAGLPLNKATLKPSLERKDSFILRPENVIATIATSMGVNPALISADLGRAQILQNILK